MWSTLPGVVLVLVLPNAAPPFPVLGTYHASDAPVSITGSLTPSFAPLDARPWLPPVLQSLCDTPLIMDEGLDMRELAALDSSSEQFQV